MVCAPSTAAGAGADVLSPTRALSLPVLRSAHAIFHDCALLASVLSGLSLTSFLRLRSVSTAFLRASYTPTTWQHHHLTITTAASLAHLRAHTPLFALLPSLTINLVSCPLQNIDEPLRGLLVRLPSLRCVRLLNCVRLTEVGVRAVLLCGALRELTVQNCGGLQSHSLQYLLDSRKRPCFPSILDRGQEDADAEALVSARTDALSSYRSAAYMAALSCMWQTDRPSYAHYQLERLDLTKYRNFNDRSLHFDDAHLESFTSLRQLNLRGCRELTDESMGRLACLSLHSLDLSFCVQLTSNGMAALADSARPLSRSLTSLTLTSVTLLTDAACEELARFTSLSHLVLSQLPKLTDHGLMLLQKGPACLSLSSVVLSWCDHLLGDWLVSVGEGWTREENERRMGADFLDYLDTTTPTNNSSGLHGDPDADAEDGSRLECDSDGDGGELADARREAVVIARRRTAQRERRRRAREKGGVGSLRQVGGEVEREMWSALRHVDVRYCHGIDVASKVILSRLRPDVELVWR